MGTFQYRSQSKIQTLENQNMNHRLLTDEEKRLNALGRYTRKKQQKRRNRRERLFDGLAEFFDVDLLTPEEVFGLAYGHGNTANLIGRRLARRAIATTRDSSNVRHMQAEAVVLPPPRRIFMSADWGAVDPNLIPEEMPNKEYDDASTIEATILKVGNVAAANPGCFRHLLLDLVVNAAGLSYEVSAAALTRKGLISIPFSAEEIDAVRKTRAFWSQFSHGRKVYWGEVTLQHLPPGDDDIAIFEAVDMATLLPGIHIPVDLRRQDYVVKLVWDEARKFKFLDFYSFKLKPLFRVPFKHTSGIGGPHRSKT